jgi:hypothetical protein
MKFALLLSALAFTFTAATSHADSSEIARKAQILGRIAHGAQVHQITGRNAESMIRKLGRENRGGEAVEFTRDLPSSQISFSDMSGYGTMRLQAAIALFESQDAKQDKNGVDRAQAFPTAEQLLKELDEMGVKFGYTDSSTAYCGVSFMGLLIVDEEAGVIYEIELTDTGTC